MFVQPRTQLIQEEGADYGGEFAKLIQGNQTWQTALAQLQKQPLYVLQICDFGVILTSFSAVATGVTLTGYGVGQYGVAPYGG